MSLSRQLFCSRYIAVLGFQLSSGARKGSPRHGFHPLYRGTWYLTATIQATRTTIKSEYPIIFVTTNALRKSLKALAGSLE